MFENLPLTSLAVNRSNDRHGELENETAAIAWLFNERQDHMRNLARDIADKQQLFEAPLVGPVADAYVVFDGNRRVTCLKLLENPRRAPTVPLQEFFAELKTKWNGNFPTHVQCQVEKDRERIDDIVFRRHTGTQGGVGRSNWDDRMKLTFIERTGREGPVNIAAEVEKLLEEKGVGPTGRLPRSNFNRLLSAENFRSRVGFKVRNRKIEFTHNEPVVVAALTRIANDLIEKKVVLGDLWDNDGKRRYLDNLEIQGILPTAAHAIHAQTETSRRPPRATTAVVNGAQAVNPNPPASQPSALPSIRDTLIPPFEYGVPWSGKTGRHHAIWNELQFKLKLREHPNAIAVLFRVLLELALENYTAARRLSGPDDTLSQRFRKVIEDLNKRDVLSDKELKELMKIRESKSLISIGTLNAYVHSPRSIPAPEDAAALWDNLAHLTVLCLKE